MSYRNVRTSPDVLGWHAGFVWSLICRRILGDVIFRCSLGGDYYRAALESVLWFQIVAVETSSHHGRGDLE